MKLIKLKNKEGRLFYLLCFIVSYSAVLQHETIRVCDENHEHCVKHCSGSFSEEVCEDDCSMISGECHNETTSYEDCHEECHTTTEWHTRIKELETYNVTKDLREDYRKSAENGANTRYPIDSNNNLAIEIKYEKFKNN